MNKKDIKNKLKEDYIKYIEKNKNEKSKIMRHYYQGHIDYIDMLFCQLFPNEYLEIYSENDY